MKDRSKYKPATVAQMKKLDSEVGQRRGFSESYERAGYHKIDQGDNKFRIYPAHAESKDRNFWMPKSVVWLTVEVDKRDEQGDKTGEKELRRRPIMTSDVHGPSQFAKKDLVKMYIEYAKAKFDDLFETEKERQDAEEVLYDFKTGIKPSLTWCMYADKHDTAGQKTLGILEVRNGVKKKINTLASDTDSEDDVLSVDPFTDPDDGIALILSKVGTKLDTVYTASLESKKSGKFQLQYIPTPLSDQDLDALEKFPSLEKLFKNSFKKQDFEYQKEGLFRFDEEYGFDFFKDEEWLEMVEEMEELVEKYIKDQVEEENEEEENESEVEKPNPKPVNKVVKPGPKPKKIEEEPEQYEPDESREEDEPEQEVEEKPKREFKKPEAKKVEKTSEQEEDDDNEAKEETMAERIARIKAKLGK